MAVVQHRQAVTASGPWARAVLPHVATFCIYVVLTTWATQFMLDAPPVPLLWPATGIGLAMVYRFGYRMVPTLVLAGLVAHLSFGAAPLDGLILSAGAAGGAAVGVFVLRRCDFTAAMERVRDVLLLLVVGAGVSAFISGLSGTLMMVGVSSAFGQTMGLCWLADTMGVVLFAPVLIGLQWPVRSWRKLAGPALLGLGAPLVTYLVFAGGLPMHLALPLSYAVFPLILFLAFRLPPWAVALATSSSAVVAVACTAAGKGPFAQASDMMPDLASLYVQLSLLQLMGLLLAAVRYERAAAEQRAREHLRTLARIGRMNAVSTMAAGIAHEINQPLCAVNSYAQAALRLLQRGEPPEMLEQPLRRVVEGGQRASGIVRRTRHFLETGENDRQACDGNALVREAVELVRPDIQRARIDLRLNLVLASPPLLVDDLEIQQVIVNLLQNAMEVVAAQDDGLPRWIEVSTRLKDEGRSMALIVADSGPGIPQGQIDSLFDPMVSHRRGGVGLGLAIARSITEAHQGRLTARNAGTDAGAIFELMLPVQPTNGK